VKAREVAFEVNGTTHTVRVHPMARLLDVLREDLRLTGTKEGCGEGECGACSVFIDGVLVNSCLVPVVQVAGCKLETIEGLSRLHAPSGLGASDTELHPLQTAFIAKGGAQCGICTPGMLMAAVNLLRQRTDADDDEIREALAGNLCRCTGYTRIVDSVVEASRLVRRRQS
jgi:carbon-monoxide dehydrogenase small subunit